MRNLQERLRAWRNRAGLTQDQAARVFVTSPQTYRNWEAGRYSPRGGYAGDVAATIDRSEAVLGKEAEVGS